MRQESGFTIIELLVTIAIAGILLSLAVPAFRDFLQSAQLSSAANTFAVSVNVAQTEATKRGLPVYMTALSPTSGNEWGPGWRVWVDAQTPAPTHPDGVFNPADGDEELLLTIPDLSFGVTLDSQKGIAEYKFSPAGGINKVDELFLCDQRDGATDRRLTLNIVGRLTVETDTLCAP